MLHLEKKEISPTHMSPLGQAISTRWHTLDGLVHGRICRDCNSGWLSAIENTSKELLSCLIQGSFYGELTANDCRNIATWAFKTCLVLNSASNYTRKIPERHSRYLYTYQLPPSYLKIHLAQFRGDEPFYWVQGPIWIVSAPGQTPTEIERLTRRSYKITLQFRQLALRVCYWPKHDWPLFEQSDKPVSIWPDTPKQLTWPRSLLVGTNGLAELHLSPKVIFPEASYTG